jgi:hypothetical protein
MKITLFTPALVAILGLALAGAPVSVHAQTSTNASAATAPSKPTKAGKTQYSGTLTAIDAGGTSITVTSTKKTLTLAIASTTTFKKDKMAATLADFAVGDKVTGSYTKDAATGAMTASSVHTKTAKTAKMPAATPAAAPATPAAQ